MPFIFSYSLNGEPASAIMDFPLDTPANYVTGGGTAGVTKGDVVLLASGLVQRAGASSASAIGVVEGTEFTGLVAQGQPYAATNSSFNASAINTSIYPNGVVKVRTDGSCVYEAPLKSGQTSAVSDVGASYGLFLDATGNPFIDKTNTTHALFRVEQLNPSDNTKVFVRILPSVAGI